MARILLVFLIGLSWLPVQAKAQVTAGSVVVVIRPIELKTERGTTSSLSPGSALNVQGVEDQTLVVAAPRIGRVDAAAVIPVAEANAYFSKLIEADQKDAVAWTGRGKVFFNKGDHDKAIADFDESLRLRPDSETLTLRGFAWKRKGDKEKAMANFDEAIKLNPKEALAWRVRGATWAGKADYKKALDHYTESIRIDPENPESLHHRVVLLSGCMEDAIRNGKQAVEDATKACELTGWKNPLFLMGLSFAYSETGDFDAAIQWLTKAIELFPKGQTAAFDKNLEQFRQRKPFRTTWK